jgi:hypothetical protein
MKIHGAIRFVAFGLLLLIVPAALSTPSSAEVGIGISVRVGPPALPVYEQPICPGPGYLWTPGYWSWSDDDGYYWVPGTWVVAPVGMLWTPGYWGWHDGLYAWHAGYWGPHIGFYGGINYGFGYGGVGFVGGEWRHGAFFYNTAVMHVDSVHIRNVYVNRTVIVRNGSHVAFNGGEGGIHARPNREEESYAREPHRAVLAEQVRHEHAASHNRALFASANHGRPAVAATGRPGEFRGHNVVAARSAGAPYRAPQVSPREARASSGGRPAANNMHAANRPAAPPSRNNSFRPMSESRPTNVHPQNQPRPQSQQRPQGQSHAENQPHPQSQSRPQHAEARAQGQPHSQPAPARMQSQPHSQPEPRGGNPAPNREKSAPRPENHGKH